LVEADERHLLRKSNFDHIKSRHIDFVICDSALSPQIVIELDDFSHRRPDRVGRDRDVNRILEIAELPILRVPDRRLKTVALDLGVSADLFVHPVARQATHVFEGAHVKVDSQLSQIGSQCAERYSPCLGHLSIR
jgi:hypothetical protein